MKGRFFACVCVGVAILAGCTLPEEGNKKAKAPCPVCPPEPPAKAMILATIHEFHLAQAGFPFSRLGDAMDAYRPDMILVDTPQDALKGTHPEDASIELEYIKHVAGTRATDLIAVGPEREEPPVSPKPEKGDEDALAREAGWLSEPNAYNMSFEQANGTEGSLKILNALSARIRYLKGDPDWTRREAWLEQQVDKVIADKQPKRMLVIVDPINRAPLEAHIFERGIGIVNPVKAVNDSKEKRDEGAVPTVVLSAWSEHLNKVQDRLHRLRPGQDRSWLEYKVSVLQLAIDKHGSCCVTLDLLQGPGGQQQNGGQIDRPNPKKK
jgi:hypothetical protein